MNNNLELIDKSKDDETVVYYISRINKKIPWPSNSNVVEFAIKDEPNKSELIKNYKILSIGDSNVKVIAIKNRFYSIVYKS